MEASKVQIGLLEGKSNWSTWKYKLCILLRGVKGGLEVLEGKLQAPKPLCGNNTSQEEKSSYVKQADEDIATHTCKLKNLWNSLQKERSKDKVTYGRTCNCDLPEILLICKILETLPAEYFSFKSSWYLMSDTDKNIDNLTSQLCAYEKALTMKCETRQEVLQTTASRRNNLTRNYCKLKGHKVRDCVKWKTDGRPPKPEKQKKDNRVKTKNFTLLAVTSAVLFCESDKDNWYVDNGATNHITNQNDIEEIDHDTIEEDNIELRRQLRYRRETRMPKHFENYVMTVAAEIIEPREPLSYKEAITCNERKYWVLAMEKEIQSLQENCTWEMKNLPVGKKAIPCKWVYKLKTNSDGSIDKYKARLVIKGYSQRKGEYYDQTYSPVAKGVVEYCRKQKYVSDPI
ncbi:hypothetical protein JTB14_022768 [Gonioctena quinquepunctata]|nr:hypothetical protein JTB14_022768 [Gonioctena quinquepunctata]